jgi:uncharacterized protein (TIGR01777 family)
MVTDLLWVLIGLQMAMGLFDTVYHHELTERLAWRPSQQHELWLHGIRNMLYAALFVVLGWTEPHGWWAIAVIGLLVVELAITLMDFVEEDLSRKLPASERINHTLLTLNYGAILVLLVPALIDRAGNATGWSAAYYGVWSYLTAFAAVGVIVSGIRDVFAARRAMRLVPRSARTLVEPLPPATRVLVTGGTGFIGRRLVRALAEAGHEVTVLTRDAHKAAALCAPFRVVTSLHQISDDARFDAIINLAGEPISDGLWTPSKRRRIVQSRLDTTADVLRLISRMRKRPAVLVNGSAIGWYGLHGDEELTERDAGLPCFSHDICEAWEREAAKVTVFGVRVVCLRIGLVLGIEGGMLSRLLTPFEFGLGGPIGSGRQWMSWIERDDLVRLIAHTIANSSLSGPVNATAPFPLRNETFSRVLAHALRRPAVFRVPAWLLRAAGGDFARELLLGGQRVLPEKALASGFRFRHETLAPALAAMLGAKSARPDIIALLPSPRRTPIPTSADRARPT